eukprot:gene37453-48991_t
MKGRWVREPLCDHYTQSYATNEKMRESNNGNGNNGNGNNGLWPAPGSECSHSVSQLTNRFRNRSNSMSYLSAQDCLKARNILFIAGFGDSLGSEQMEMLNRHASDILGRAGWEIFDAYPITVGRPDGVVDSLHYRGGVSLAMTDALLTMICHG